MTIFEAYNNTKKKLEEFGLEDYVFEAKQIIKHITGLSSSQILMNYTRPLTQYQQNQLTALLKQREVRYPLQYIFGEWAFYGNNFKVGPGVLIPRADTEILVDKCIEFLGETENANVLELCAGSGCIGISIAKAKTDANVVMLEKYSEAAAYAEKNIALNGVANVQLITGDVFESDGADGCYDIVVSNPPYIPPYEMDMISPETRFEPQTALAGGADGLDFYRAIVKNYKNSLKAGGMIAFEVGINAADKVEEILKNSGFAKTGTKTDYNGVKRVVFAFNK